MGQSFLKWCQCLCANTQTIILRCGFFCKAWTMRRSEQRQRFCMCYIWEERKGVVASVSKCSFSSSSYFLSSWTFHSRSMLYIQYLWNKVWRECFFIQWISAICTKRYLPYLQVSKSICFSHLHSRIDFFSIFIPKRIKKWHSETFYSIFIRSCGPKVQRFG